MKRKVSLKDIAQKAGVSTTLVSYVLNNQKENRINKETAKKIRDIAFKLNYRPNQIAKSLKTNKTFTIGLIVADISNPFSSSLARIIEDEGDKHGYTVIFGSSDEEEHKSGKLIHALLNRQVDGLIISPPAKSELQIIQLQKQGIPFVLVDRYFPEIDANHVCLDNFSAAFDAVQHFINAGRKTIGMVAYKSPLIHLQEREKGYLSALKKANLSDKKRWLREVDISNDQSEIESAVQSLLLPDNPIDALLLGSNRIAVAALKYINSLSIKVPDKLAIISFDETEIFDFFPAPLAYIKQPLQEMGQMATRILLNNINKKKKTEQVYLPAQLVIRKSTIN